MKIVISMLFGVVLIVPVYTAAEPTFEAVERENKTTLKEALENRKTIRDFSGDTLSKDVFDGILWAAYGNTHNRDDVKMRTAPSAMASYPVELYLAVNNFETSPENGIYRYRDDNLQIVKPGNHLDTVQAMSAGQKFVSQSNLVFFMVYHPEKMGNRAAGSGRDMALLECGHIGQNILLMASAYGLGGVPKASFDREKLPAYLGLEPGDEILYMICVGTLRQDSPK